MRIKKRMRIEDSMALMLLQPASPFKVDLEQRLEEFIHEITRKEHEESARMFVFLSCEFVDKSFQPLFQVHLKRMRIEGA